MVATRIEIGLNAAIVAVEAQTPSILAVGNGAGQPEGLPFGRFDPLSHRTMELGLRALVEEQTALRLGYVEQLYTFGDRGRHARPGDVGPHVTSVGYLALARQSPESLESIARSGARWRAWYGYFPWEDWRDGRPDILDESILPYLERWCGRP
ncbi:MAG TPA: NAD regulator, partial [Afifellaceae bacterium]|nr:NAD regulator [Afifellaceae bacterium]